MKEKKIRISPRTDVMSARLHTKYSISDSENDDRKSDDIAFLHKG